jgi:uncharacterized membrane protein YfcA
MTAPSSSAALVAGRRGSAAWPLATGALIGTLGGLIGLGGAEFRLPLLMALFGFAALQAVIVNKAMSLVVVILLLVAIAVVLAGTHVAELGSLDLPPVPRATAGVVAGVLIGMVAAFMGVAGGELLIPTIVLLFGADIRLAGSLSLLVSLPTMLVAFTRYSRDSTFAVLGQNLRFVAFMGAGSIAGAVAGGALLQYVAGPALIGGLALILLISAAKVWHHPEGP